jgi:hypothetical protein
VSADDLGQVEKYLEKGKMPNGRISGKKQEKRDIL